MKPKYNRFLRVAFPSLIILPAMAQMASAAAIMPDGAGNILMTVVGSVNGVSAGDASSISNSGSIIGQSGDGAIVGNGATVSNLTTFDTGPFGAIFGGQITGNSDGVVAGNNLTLTNQNRGSIIGAAGDGIAAGNDANITNASGANVTGGDKGISAGTGLTLNNSGTITGQNDDGVAATTGANITNSGTITANGVNGDGIYLEANGVVNNTGSIVSNFDDGIDSAILISIGSGYAINQDLSLNFGYRGEFSTGDGVDSNGASVGLSYEF